MKSIVLILVLLSGVISGYFIGDYRGRESRIALAKAIETGKAALKEREAAVASLNKDLQAINVKYADDIARLGADYDKKTAEWERTKSALDQTISTQNKKLTELNVDLSQLLVAAGAATGSDKKQIDKKIASLTATIASLRGSIDANQCLKTPVPAEVLSAIGQFAAGGL